MTRVKNAAAAELAHLRAASLTPERRAEIGRSGGLTAAANRMKLRQALAAAERRAAEAEKQLRAAENKLHAATSSDPRRETEAGTTIEQ